MPDPVPRWFIDELVALYLAFPSAGTMPAHAPPVWWRQLGSYPEAAIRRAFLRAPKELDDARYIPSVEQVRRFADAETKVLPPPRGNLSLTALPPPVDGRTLPAENPFAKLAMSWVKESHELRLDRDQPTPPEIGERRIRELNDMLAGKFDL